MLFPVKYDIHYLGISKYFLKLVCKKWQESDYIILIKMFRWTHSHTTTHIETHIPGLRTTQPPFSCWCIHAFQPLAPFSPIRGSPLSQKGSKNSTCCFRQDQPKQNIWKNSFCCCTDIISVNLGFPDPTSMYLDVISVSEDFVRHCLRFSRTVEYFSYGCGTSGLSSSLLMKIKFVLKGNRV